MWKQLIELFYAQVMLGIRRVKDVKVAKQELNRKKRGGSLNHFFPRSS